MTKRHQNPLAKIVADKGLCFCIELNGSDTIFAKLNEKYRQLLNER